MTVQEGVVRGLFLIQQLFREKVLGLNYKVYCKMFCTVKMNYSLPYPLEFLYEETI